MHAGDIVTETCRASLQQKKYCFKHRRQSTQSGAGGQQWPYRKQNRYSN